MEYIRDSWEERRIKGSDEASKAKESTLKQSRGPVFKALRKLSVE